MTKTNSVFVVEGITDKALLTRYFDTEIVITNGAYVSHETINYINGLEKSHDIIIITDPDGPGRTIANKLLKVIFTAKQVHIAKNVSVKKGKVGLAETDVELLLPRILPLISPPVSGPPPLTLADLMQYEQYDHYYKEKLRNSFPVGAVNNRTLIKRLAYLGVSKEMVDAVIYG